MSRENKNGFDIDKDAEKIIPTKTKLKNEIFDWLNIFSVVIVVIILIFTFIFKPAIIEGKSMEDTLYANERVVITNLFYEPKYGDVVVISRNVNNTYENGTERSNLPIIKRVIATEGQVVDIDFEKGIVYVDGKALNEPYIKTPTNQSDDIIFPVTVKKDCVFVMGDNRNISLDSRSSRIGDNGMIDKRYILGHVICRVYPFEKFGPLKKYN